MLEKYYGPRHVENKRLEEAVMVTIQNEVDLEAICKKNSKIIIYGAGMVAHEVVRYLLGSPYRENIYCIVVKSKKNNPSEILGIPILQLEEFLELFINSVVIIATLENLHNQIEEELKLHYCKNVLAISNNCYYAIKKKNLDFCAEILCMQRKLLDGLQLIEQKSDYNSELGEVRIVNCQTFSPYMNIHKGRNMVIVATGPSLQKYKPIPNAIHIGVNTAYKATSIKFDYYFVQDYTGKSIQTVNDIKRKPFIKFFGKFLECSDFHRQLGGTMEIPEQKALEAGAMRYYIDWPPESPIHRDIRYAPLMEYHSVIFPAIQFALFCNPEKIYLVGCDCTNQGHFNQDKQDTLMIESVFRGYAALKEFAEKHYPETEIISINPVGLKGFFKEIYTDDL